VIAVIGDGALSGGLAFEGLNNLGSSSSGMIVVLNDNEMSISRNVGALSKYLTKVITDKRYTKLKAEIWGRLGTSTVGKSIRGIVKNIDDAVKHAVIPGKLFEDMGLRYLGPVDGHNIAGLISVFKSVKEHYPTPQLVHVITKKGKGYQFAEKDATKYHGIGSFSRDTGDVIRQPMITPLPTYSDVFGKTLVELAATRPAVTAITAAMREGTQLVKFSKEYPTRFFDVGIAESHAVTFAAGLARTGLTPVVALYSTFLQRSYDQILHDVALDHLHVVFCIDRAGLVGDDGPTHHGIFDLSFVRSVPGAIIMAPSNGDELRQMLYTAIDCCDGPVFIRYPRGVTPAIPVDTPFEAFPCGLPAVIASGNDIALVAVGDFMTTALETARILEQQGIKPSVIDARFVKPLDISFYTTLFKEHQLIVTMENNSLVGGFGSGVMELMHSLDGKNKTDVLTIGLPDVFISHGDKLLLLKNMGLDAASIAHRIMQRMAPQARKCTGKTRHFAIQKA
jgi:1-deoxy-D-xylulose-5-phosphate synthase